MSHAVLVSAVKSEWLSTMKKEMPPEWMEAMKKFGDCAVVKAAINAKPIQDPELDRMRYAGRTIFDVFKKLHDLGGPNTTKH